MGFFPKVKKTRNPFSKKTGPKTKNPFAKKRGTKKSLKDRTLDA
jgi:hypothetical protein